MTPEQIDVVKSNFKVVETISDDAAALFYQKLFELNPELKKLFSSDMVEQGRALMKMIGYAVSNLDRIEDIVEPVKKLGIRHIKYGVKAEDYNTVGEALLWTLDKGLGDAFTDEAKEAWTLTYGILADTMMQAAYGEASSEAGSEV